MKHIKLFENFDENAIREKCLSYGIPNFKLNDDGSIDVDDSIDLSCYSFEELPIVFNKINGDFSCSGGELTTLKGCPRYVNGDFSCSNNNFKNFIGAPINVTGNFYCGSNKLTSLEGLMTDIGGELFIKTDKLTPIYDIMCDDMEHINDFYNFHIITDLDSYKPTINMKRLNRFIDLYDIKPLSYNTLDNISVYYNKIV